MADYDTVNVIDGPITAEDALRYVNTHDPESGRELSDAERQNVAALISEAAAANAQWKQAQVGLHPLDALRALGSPTIQHPVERQPDSQGAAQAPATDAPGATGPPAQAEAPPPPPPAPAPAPAPAPPPAAPPGEAGQAAPEGGQL